MQSILGARAVQYLQEKLNAGTSGELKKKLMRILLPVPKSRFEDVQNLNFHLLLNGEKVQQGNSRDMLFTIDHIISYVSKFMTLKTGDIIFTGTPVGVGPVHINDRLQGFLEDEKMFDFLVK